MTRLGLIGVDDEFRARLAGALGEGAVLVRCGVDDLDGDLPPTIVVGAGIAGLTSAAILAVDVWGQTSQNLMLTSVASSTCCCRITTLCPLLVKCCSTSASCSVSAMCSAAKRSGPQA